MIPLSQIIDDLKLDRNIVAQILFPGNKYPGFSLKRVEDGKSELTSSQLIQLAEYMDVPIESLFDESWKASYDGNFHDFTFGEYRARLNTDTWETKLFSGSYLIYEGVIFKGSTPLREYFNKLNSLILKFEKNA